MSGERGQTSTEFIAVLLILGLLVFSVRSLPIGNLVRAPLKSTVCGVLQRDGCTTADAQAPERAPQVAPPPRASEYAMSTDTDAGWEQDGGPLADTDLSAGAMSYLATAAGNDRKDDPCRTRRAEEWANPKRDRNATWAPGVGTRVYSVGIASYRHTCGSYYFMRHQIYINTAAFPYGYKFSIYVSTRRSDGTWQGVWRTVKGEQRMQELIVDQDRDVRPGQDITDVHVRHCACTWGSGALPISATLKGRYVPYGGPEAKPRD